MKVSNGKAYRYIPSLWDMADPPYGVSAGLLKSGDIVRVKNLHGCPPCNMMGHAHIVSADTGDFLGLVSTHSLVRFFNKH